MAKCEDCGPVPLAAGTSDFGLSNGWNLLKKTINSSITVLYM